MKSKGNIQVVLEGRGPLTLRPNDYRRTGGEGSIYEASKTAIKIFIDKRKVIWNNIAAKLDFFRKNPNRYIVSPQGFVKTPKGETIGYYMEYIDGEPITRLFTNDFRRRTNFNDRNASLLVERMREIVMFAHDHNALLIDANELSYIVIMNQSKEPEPRIIDVDCWVIDNYWPPVLPIMLSIRDWHTKGWNKGTDWFAWAVVTFQVYIGIHPYKGTLNGFRRKDLEGRMKANASVFSPGVRLNRAVRDFSLIPGPLLDWYVATFQNGKREAPPSPFETGIAVTRVSRLMYAVTTSSGVLIFNKLFSKVDDQAIRIFPCGIVLLNSGKLINLSTKREIGVSQSRDCEIIRVENGWLKAFIDNGKINLSHINETSLNEKWLKLDLKGQKLVRYENRMFVATDQGLTEVVLKILGKPILSVGQTWGVMVNSTRWFEGVGIQDTMGATYVIAPFGDDSCAQIRIRELDNLQPVMAKAGNRFITVIGLDQAGIYQKIELTMDQGYSNYKIWQGITDNPDLNIAILPKGVCATIVKDGELDIFVPTTGLLNRVQDKQISTEMILANWNDKVVYIQDGDVWSMQMRR